MEYKRIVIWAAKPCFKSARKLAKELSTACGLPAITIGSMNTKYQPRWADYVINWGNSKQPNWMFHTAINSYFEVAYAVDKLSTLKTLDVCDVNIVEYTTEPPTESGLWVARTKLNGHSGEGIILFDPSTDPVPNAPLYTKYKKKKHEYRVHVFAGNVIDVTWKRKRKGVVADNKIRNWKNGWVYCREGITYKPEMLDLAKAACYYLGLDFGAVDIIYNELEDKYYVLEVNTAPGLTGSTLAAYTNAFTKEITK